MHVPHHQFPFLANECYEFVPKQKKIVFLDNGLNPYYIYYGNDNAESPSYDIESYKESIEGETQDLCTLSNAEKHIVETKKVPKDNSIYFNITIAAVSIILIFLIIRKLNYHESK